MSAPSGAPGPGSLVIRRVRLDEPVAAALVDELQADLAVRYGGPDPVGTPAELFWPPRGVFLVAELDGVPVGCGGLKELDTGVGELKRMYVRPAARGRGISRALLRALEDEARAFGTPRLRLITGTAQPEAMALYASAGWTPGEAYGPAIEHGWVEARVFERDLSAAAGSPRDPAA
jgi:GNAT superfamily N-acetyltransferase